MQEDEIIVYDHIVSEANDFLFKHFDPIYDTHQIQNLRENEWLCDKVHMHVVTIDSSLWVLKNQSKFQDQLNNLSLLLMQSLLMF